MPRPRKPPFAPQALTKLGKLHMAPEVEREASAAALDLLAHVRTMIANGGHNMAFGRMVGLLKVLTPYVIKQSGAGLGEPEETNEPMTLDTLIKSLEGLSEQDKAKLVGALAPKQRQIENVFREPAFDEADSHDEIVASMKSVEHGNECNCWSCKAKRLEERVG